MTAPLDVLREMGRVLPGSQGQAVREAVAELEMWRALIVLARKEDGDGDELQARAEQAEAKALASNADIEPLVQAVEAGDALWTALRNAKGEPFGPDIIAAMGEYERATGKR